MKISSEQWGKLPDGREAVLVTMVNSSGASVEVSNYGGIFRSITVPDRTGRLSNVVLNFETPAEYEKGIGYIGATVGRYANRIRGAAFRLGEKTFALDKNEGGNILHGGAAGFHQKLWDYDIDGDHVRLSVKSPRGEAGFPGNVEAVVEIYWTEENVLRLVYTAVSDEDTVLSLTNHSYFNLGYGGSVLNHQLQLCAEEYTPLDSELLPTGELLPVAGTRFDFRALRTVGQAFDDNFALDREAEFAALLVAPESGRAVRVSTDMPAVQLYTGGGLRGPRHSAYSGLCLETQHFPDAPNRPNFPSPILKAGEEYRYTTTYAFEMAE